MKFSQIVASLMVVSFFSILLFGCTGTTADTDLTKLNEATVKHVNTNDNQTHVDVFPQDRTSWNINIDFIEYNSEGFVIKIIDYDNQGFWLNPLYYILERKEGDTWVKLTNMNPQSALNYEYSGGWWCPKKKGVIELTITNSIDAIKNTSIISGHYKLTVVLSGRDFSTEFDISD